MVSSRDSSNGPDWTDILVVMQSLEEELCCRVTLTFDRKMHGGVKVLSAVATAHPWNVTQRDARRTVSVSAICSRHGASLVSAAMYRLLLALDYEASKAWAQRIVNGQ